uniref:Uncharacterized protein n=1 Tax=Human betaherpesvirus 6 TaxID=10368 RepID=A0A1W6J4Q9_9BETA|nr:hypothetical protein [Human betaherpesvirus 6]ARM09418.1 hypothetical protein [Human betaherpesvirus 6]
MSEVANLSSAPTGHGSANLQCAKVETKSHTSSADSGRVTRVRTNAVHLTSGTSASHRKSRPAEKEHEGGHRAADARLQADMPRNGEPQNILFSVRNPR